MRRPRFILDAGPLVAALNARDKHHAWAARVLDAIGEPPVTSESVLTEACWHLRASPDTVARVLEMPARGDLVLWPIVAEEGVELAAKIRKYSSRMDMADACVVRLAELFAPAKVITIDVEDFTLYRREGGYPIPLIHP